MRIYFIFLLGISSPAYTTEVSPTKNKTLADVVSDFKVHEGAYSLSTKSPGAGSFCQSQIAELILSNDQGSISIHLGEEISLPHLESEKFQEPADKGCEFSFENRIGKNRIQQQVRYQCQQKTKGFTKIHTIDFAEKSANYTYEYNGAKGKPLKLVCGLTLVPGKE